MPVTLRRAAIGASILAIFWLVAFNSRAQTGANQPNTGMADPAALMRAFDKFVAGGGGASLNVPLVSLRGLTSEDLNAGGVVDINLIGGSIVSEVRFLPPGGSFELWLIDNRPADGHTTLAEPHDSFIKAGSYVEQPQPGVYRLSVSLGAQAFASFFPDRAFVVRAGQSPLGSFLLTGSSATFDRLSRRQVRFVDSPGVEIGFDPTAATTRAANFARLAAQGRRLFLKETFGGNGRTCGTCHVESNNFTIDPEFIATLPSTDPLFVAETTAGLAQLENPELMRHFGLIGVNADGFHRGLVFRATQNVQALGNSSVRPDPSFVGDFSTNGRNPEPPERLGWGNDGAPLRDFTMVAIAQHAPTRLERVRGRDFRVPTDEELDALVAYQLPLGRQEDFNLPLLELKSSFATMGKALYLDTGVFGASGHKNCNACHFNAGGTGAFSFNPQKPGFPRLDGSPNNGNIAAPTNVNETALSLILRLPRDGGFGQKFLPVLGSFGNDADPRAIGHLELEEFNSGPLVESADTGPFFHNHTVQSLEEAVAFYGTPAFQRSPFHRFGVIPVTISSDPNDPEVQAISAFLRVLNALENIRSSLNVVDRGRGMSNLEDARELARLAHAETVDAVQALSRGALAKSPESGILTALGHLLAAEAVLEAAARPLAVSGIGSMLEQAGSRLRAARAALANHATLPPSFQN